MSANSTLAPGMKEGDITVTVTPEQQATYNAWAIDKFWADYIMYAWYAMYGLSILPSVTAMPFILALKGFVNIYLAVDAVFKFLGLAFHPANEAYIWNMDNWWGYSFRRWIVDGFLTPMHFFTQAIPLVNWMLNLITMMAYYANVFIF